jgi:glycosyltransferase involved in cell wall biosynthesis
MLSPDKTILIILPKLTGYGGMELENIGFINAMAEKTDSKIRVFTIEVDNQSKAQITNDVDYYKVKPNLIFKCISIWFFKLLIKSRFNLRKALRIYLGRYPHLIESYLKNQTHTGDIIFCSLHPQNFVQYIQQFCNKNDRQFIFHQISKPNPKYKSFYTSLSEKNLILISSQEKYQEIKKINKKPKFKNIKQWIYINENNFISLKNNFNQNDIVFGLISRLYKEKNILLLLKAVKVIKKMDFNVFIYGNGKELDSLKDFVTEHKISNKIQFKGSIDYKKRHKAYENIDIFICTSINEGGPITVLEAMAAGLPVISTNVGDVPNRVINDHNGYVLTDNDSPIELSKLMLNYINNPKLIAKHGENGRIRYKKEYYSQIAKECFVNCVIHDI